MTTITHGEVAARTGILIPPHLIAQAEVPTAQRGWRQGDVYIARMQDRAQVGKGIPLTGAGHKVIAGDADRNSHVLNGDGVFYPARAGATLVDYGVLVVPEGGLAVLTHTGEHGSVALPAGQWRVWGQVSYEAELRRAAD